MAEPAEASELNGRVDEPTTAATVAAEDLAQVDGSSDGEGEKAARERLKKTSIAGLAQKSTDNGSEAHPLSQSMTMDTDQVDINNGTRGRPAKKRSFEDLTRGESTVEETTEASEQPLPKSGHHKRMRSRDVASGEHVIGKFEADIASPLHEESDLEAQKSPGGPGVLIDAPLDEGTGRPDTDMPVTSVEPTTAEPTTDNGLNVDQSSSNAQIKPTSGFANASSSSPFGSFAQAKSSTATAEGEIGQKTKSTSPSAFASSGLSAFSSSEKSPFGAAAGKPSGGFGGNLSGGTFGSSSSLSGGFGKATTASVFASNPSSGFGSGGGFGSSSGFGSSTGFGAPKAFGSGISSFAGSSGTSGKFGTGKPFGVSRDEDEDGSDNEGEESDEQKLDDEAQQDSRFQEQDVETGEENEETVFSCRAKLYHFEKEWKERGVGTFKINVRHAEASLSTVTSKPDQSKSASDDERAESKKALDDVEAGNEGENFTVTERRARLIMRTDGVHRVILNTPIFKDMRIGQQDGSEPIGKTMHMTGLEDGKPRAFQIKIAKEDVLKDLYWRVIDLQSELP